MRRNLPVTQREQRFPADEQLITTTNLKGVITDVNDAFERISGFTRDQLVGQAHNIIRHPDMPQAAFQDLWTTLKAGRSWRGMVKNRCSNGDYYWVDAYVTPILRKGAVVEYQSVRTCPEPEQVRRAEAVYRVWCQGRLPWYLRLPRPGLGLTIAMALALPTAAALMAARGEAQGLVAAGAGLAGAILAWQALRPLQRSISQAECSQAVMHYIYTGRQDAAGQLAFALALGRTELAAVVARLFYSSQFLQQGRDRAQAQVRASLDSVQNQQADAEQIVTAAEHLAQSVHEVASRAAESSTAAAQAVDRTGEAQHLVDGTCSAIAGVSAQLDQARTGIAQLASRSQEIGTVVDVIKDVAEQTNLLALNAAIEAARAGEQGRGFAVVADAVRGLAQRTHESTHQIRVIVEALQAETGTAVEVIDQGVSTVGETVSLCDQVKHTLGATLQDVTAIAHYMQDIAAANEEQATLGDQVKRQVLHLDELSRASVQASNRASDETERLGEHIGEIHRLAGHFLHALAPEPGRVPADRLKAAAGRPGV